MWVMSTVLKLEILSTSSEKTEEIGATIGANLKGGEIIELASDLGGGKTTFTRGLARGAGSSDMVGSPTFTVSKIYQADDLRIHHFDLYRLQEAGLLGYEIAELQEDSKNVLVLEWAGVAGDVLPENRLTITFAPVSEDSRIIEIAGKKSFDYLLEGLTST